MKWGFPIIQPGSVREPIHGEFFASDDVNTRPGNALVREGIQNSLDASSNPDEPVVVRIYLSGELEALKKPDIGRYMGGAWDHIRADGNGLSSDLPKRNDDPCRFLVFEDFHTIGLKGDQDQQYLPREKKENHFFNFFRAEGNTDKDTTKKGSWGVGKHVFWRASQINTVFGLSVTEDHDGFFMGRSILKSHAVGKERDRKYQTGYFGIWDKPAFVTPVIDQECVSEFVKTFRLDRRCQNGDTGLSLVIPYHDDDITGGTVVQSVIDDYFYPILAGELEVRVETPDTRNVYLCRESLIDNVKKLGEKYATPIRLARISLAQWAQTLSKKDRHFLNSPHENCQWGSEMFSGDLLEKITEEHNSGRQIAIRVPVGICKKSMQETQKSHFDVYMHNVMSDGSEKPIFIRDELIIPSVKSPLIRGGVLALVVAKHRPIAEFLRKAENPSHTEWQHARLKDEYRGHKKTLGFVQESVYRVIRAISQSGEVDEDLLADIFFIPKEGDESSVGRNPPVPPKVESFDITRLQGGFSITRSRKAKCPLPSGLHVLVAYNTRRGNPIKKYTLGDFDVKSCPIQVNSKDLAILEKEGNCIRAQIQSDGFSLRVTGFDENRELYIMAHEVSQ